MTFKKKKVILVQMEVPQKKIILKKNSNQKINKNGHSSIQGFLK